MDAICRASSSVSAATMAIWRLDRPRSLSAAGARRNSVRVSRTLTARIGNDLQLFVFGGHQSAVLSRRIVNSMAPSGSSRHRSTSLM
jgi:hypothetical protein